MQQIIFSICLYNQNDQGKSDKMSNTSVEKNVKNQQNYQSNEKSSLPTLPNIPIRSQGNGNHESPHHAQQQQKIYNSTNDQKVIPGYNFQSLFRKKSHIRLARKKNKEEAQKKNSNLKLECIEKETKNTQKGHWTNQENKLYHWFLEIHNRHFILKYLRRTDKIFKSMAHFIRTRQAEQCRSHHQKMQKKYHNFYQILLKLRMDFYGTANTDLLRIELEQNGYNVKQHAIISELQLKNGELIRNQSKRQDYNEEDSIKNSLEEEISSKQENSLFGENYQKELDFKIKYQ